MPAYDYRCPACDETFEIIRPAGSSAEVQCPSCGTQAKRVFTPVGVVFKGSGFHNTDYRSPPARPDAASEATTSPKSTPESAPACPAAKAGGGCGSCPGAG